MEQNILVIQLTKYKPNNKNLSHQLHSRWFGLQPINLLPIMPTTLFTMNSRNFSMSGECMTERDCYIAMLWNINCGRFFFKS